MANIPGAAAAPLPPLTFATHSNFIPGATTVPTYSGDIQFVECSASVPIIPNTIPWLNRGLLRAYYPDDAYFHVWKNSESVDNVNGGVMVTNHGIITLRLRDKMRIDMSIDKAIRVINYKRNIVLALSATGNQAALLHANGRVYQYGSRVEILGHDAGGNNKYAKMWHKGISFTSDQSALVYLVDSAGTRTTADSFSDLKHDFSLQIFYGESRHGPEYVQEAIGLLQYSSYWMTDDGTENWVINNIRISQTFEGVIRITRGDNKYSLRTSPLNGTGNLSSPYVHCTGSMGEKRHLFVRRGERRMHYDGSKFILRNAGHSAGFDEKHQLKVY